MKCVYMYVCMCVCVCVEPLSVVFVPAQHYHPTPTWVISGECVSGPTIEGYMSASSSMCVFVCLRVPASVFVSL